MKWNTIWCCHRVFYSENPQNVFTLFQCPPYRLAHSALCWWSFVCLVVPQKQKCSVSCLTRRAPESDTELESNRESPLWVNSELSRNLSTPVLWWMDHSLIWRHLVVSAYLLSSSFKKNLLPGAILIHFGCNRTSTSTTTEVNCFYPAKMIHFSVCTKCSWLNFFRNPK